MDATLQAKIRQDWRRDLPLVLNGKDPMGTTIYNGIPVKNWSDPGPPMKNYPMEQVVAAVCRASGMNILHLQGPRKCKEYVRPRQLAYLLLRDFCPSKSLPEIGRMMKKRDHTVALHGIKAARKRLASDPEYRELYDRAVRYIEGKTDGCDRFDEAVSNLKGVP